jgi:hypothetical protein
MSSLLAIPVDANIPGWIVLAIFSLLFLLLGVWIWRFRRLLVRLFAKHQFDEPTLKDVQARVDLIDQECPRFTFAAERVANMSFRGQKVSIICGPVAWSDAITHSTNAPTRSRMLINHIGCDRTPTFLSQPSLVHKTLSFG